MLIVETRDRLVRQAEVGNHYLGVGVDQIMRELEKLRATTPSRRTVYHILQAAGRIVKAEATGGYR